MGPSLGAEFLAAMGDIRRFASADRLAAFASLHEPKSRTYYDRKRSEGKRHNQAVLALARRKVDVLWAMLRDNTHYESPVKAA